MTDPHNPLPIFITPPGDPSHMAAALAEARADLTRLVDHARPRVARDGADIATSQLVQGLLDSPDWDRLELASVLGAAVAAIALLTPREV